MELLYPVSSSPPRNDAPGSGPITVLVNRSVPAAEAPGLLATVNGLLEEFGRFPGTDGSLVFRRESGGEVEISIVQRFATAADHDAWVASPAFARWREAVAPAVPSTDHVRRYSGMDALFVSRSAPDAPPRWKMAVLLLVAVFPMSLAMSRWAGPLLAGMSLAAGALLTSVAMVGAMTWIITPLLTRIFQAWLQPAR